MSSDGSVRSSHAMLDRASRLEKARKIATLLGEETLRSARVLDIGTGAGVIASELGRLVGPGGAVQSVDVNDERIVTSGYAFTQVTGTLLPFPDTSFDVVISNHVIEHVGERPEQLAHLREIDRVLKPGGTLYLASPSRLSLVEPHFHLPVLSWLPARAADAYVRVTGRGARYDCLLLTRRGLRRAFDATRLRAEDRSVDAFRLFVNESGAGAIARTIGDLPDVLLAPLTAIIPTMVFVARRPE